MFLNLVTTSLRIIYWKGQILWQENIALSAKSVAKSEGVRNNDDVIYEWPSYQFFHGFKIRFADADDDDGQGKLWGRNDCLETKYN